MKILLALGFCILAFLAQAKYNPPKDSIGNYKDMAQYHTDQKWKNSGVEGDKMSLEQFKKQKQTREDRRLERRAKKDGSYVPPEKNFEALDKDKDGFISKDELKDSYQQQEDSRKLTKDEERYKAQQMRKNPPQEEPKEETPAE